MFPLNEPWQPILNWDTAAGKTLRALIAALPTARHYKITLFGSSPLQIALDPTLLSADVDVFSDDDLRDAINRAGLTREKADVYVQECAELNFKTTPKWKDRAFVTTVKNCTLRLPHPIDILIAKLHRLEEKDLAAFRIVLAKTGHPTADELKKELQDAVDLFRPNFDEEATGDILTNTRLLWRELYETDINVRQEIIQPALLKRKQGYDLPNEDYKNRLREIGDSRYGERS